MIGQCPKCGNWHTNPYFCPADLSNRGASEPLRDWRDAEIERLDAQLAEAKALIAAAQKVTCKTCGGRGIYRVGYVDRGGELFPCPDCADLRALLPKVKP